MKKILIFIISMLFLIEPVFANEFELESQYVIMINMNEDTILYEKNADEKVEIASLTKIITAITVIENTSDLNKKVLITSKMLTGLDGYAKLGLKPNDSLTILELLYATMLPSAADAAQALAYEVGGSIESFSNLMNEEIKKIGVISSNFNNPVGMDDLENYSTARDLSIILKYSLKNETFKTMFESDNYYIKSLDKTINKTLVSKSKENNLDISIIKGAKTGFTYDAGLCLASTAFINNVNYMIININGPIDDLSYIEDPVELYTYYSNNFEYKEIISVGEKLVTLPVKNSKVKEININSKESKKLYLPKKFKKEDLEIKYKGIEEITDKNKLGDKLGTIDFIYNNETIYSIEVKLEEEIKYYNFLPYFIITEILSILIIILILLLIKKRIRRKKKHKKIIYNKGVTLL